MKIPKLFAIICVAGFSAYLLHAARPDSEAQAKARAALEQAEPQPAAPAVNAPPAAVASPAPAAQPPVQLITAPSNSNAGLSPEALTKARMQLRMSMTQLDGQLAGGSTSGTSGGLSPEALAKARELLRQTVAQLDAQPGENVAMAPAGYVAKPGMIHPVVMSSRMLSPETETKVRAALHQLMAQLNARITPEMEAKARTALHEAIAELDLKNKAAAEMAARIEQEKAAADKGTALVKPAATPPSAPTPTSEQVLSTLSGPKEKKLSDLLALYKADTITPAEYHQERAKIIAEP